MSAKERRGPDDRTGERASRASEIKDSSRGVSKDKSKLGKSILNHTTLSVWAATLILCGVLVFGLRQIRDRVQGMRDTVEQVWQENKLLLEGVDELLARTQQLNRNAEAGLPAAETPVKQEQSKVEQSDPEDLATKYKIYYRTKEGEDLTLIGEKFDVSVDQLRLWNALKASDSLIPGQVLVINKSTQTDKPVDVVLAPSPPDDRGVTKPEEPREADPLSQGLASAPPPQNETKRDAPVAEEMSVAEPDPFEETGDLLAAGGEEPTPDLSEEVADEPEPVDDFVHIVQNGESLSGIGQKYGVSWLTLAAVNGIAPPGTIYVGQRLRIPEGAELEEAPLPTSEVTHRVRPGENLYRIGLAYDIGWEQIARANGITRPTDLYAGQILKIPVARGGPEN